MAAQPLLSLLYKYFMHYINWPQRDIYNFYVGDSSRVISTFTIYSQKANDHPHQLRSARSIADAGEDTRPHRRGEVEQQ